MSSATHEKREIKTTSKFSTRTVYGTYGTQQTLNPVYGREEVGGVIYGVIIMGVAH